MELKKQFIETLFLHHDGIILGCTLAALKNQGFYDFLLNKQLASAKELETSFPCKAGYLQVALRSLASQGWVRRKEEPNSGEIFFEVTNKGLIASKAIEKYNNIFNTIYKNPFIQDFVFTEKSLADEKHTHSIQELVNKAIMQWDLAPCEKLERDVFNIITHHLNGMLIAPFMIILKKQKLLDQPVINLKEENNFILNTVYPLFEKLSWAYKKSSLLELTEMGKLASQYALHYGLTLSYFPMLSRLQEIIFTSLRNQTHGMLKGHENHVDRRLNVIASGEAHKHYFQDTNKIFIDIFNQEPIENQPKFIMDTGCGDGTWLKMIYNLIKEETKRGQYLSDYPLLMIGSDYNIKAQETAKETLENEQVHCLIIFGDIGNPYQMDLELQKNKIKMDEGLHIRAFIDHNRPYIPPRRRQDADRRSPLSTGVYVDETGQMIPNHYFEQQFVEHFEKWIPYVSKHGLIVIEAHNIEPTTSAEYIGKTHAIAFDTYHGYSNQYPIDYNAFMKLTQEAGLETEVGYQTTYPKNLPFIAISSNYFTEKNLTSYKKVF